VYTSGAWETVSQSSWMWDLFCVGEPNTRHGWSCSYEMFPFSYIEMIQDLCSARVIGTYTFLGDKLRVQMPLGFLI